MTIQQKYSSISRYWLLLVLCLFASISQALASIVVTPVNKTICDNDATTFSVPANYTTYQWYRRFDSNSPWVLIQIAGHGASYTTGIQGEYRCDVTKDGITETSESAKLTVVIAPFITGIIAPSVCNGTNLVASVVLGPTNGNDLSAYEWTLGGTSVGAGTPIGNQVPDLVIPVSATQSGSVLTVSVSNICFTTTSDNKPIVVHPPPPLPNPVTRDYCQKETPITLSISESSNQATWYNALTGGSEIPTPTPDTSLPGTQTWWVSQKVAYPDGPVCEGNRATATVIVHPIPAAPLTATNIDLCLNDPDTTLQAQGTNIRWYDEQKMPLSAAPQINTSVAGTQIYYVTQSNGNCVSPIDDGKVTVLIRSRANVDAIELSYSAELCPNTNTVIEVVSQVPNSTFRWYTHDGKTGFIQTGSTLTTPV